MEKVPEHGGRGLLSRGCLGLRLPSLLLSRASRVLPQSVLWYRLVPSASPLTREGHLRVHRGEGYQSHIGQKVTEAQTEVEVTFWGEVE